ncbi:restriction endonuclease [Mesorhizobium sp. A556]
MGSYIVPIIGFLIIVVGGSWLFGAHNLMIMVTICIVCFVAWLLWLVIAWFSESARQTEMTGQLAANRRADEQRQEDTIKRWHRTAEEHRDTLVLKYRQLVVKNEYGAPELQSWTKELARFRLSTGISGLDHAISQFDRDITGRVQGWVLVANATRKDSEFTSTDPFEYERWCAMTLRQHGWQASTTKGGGDQGVDVVASKDGRKVAIQCKLYTSGPVGNKAVQEVHAAAGFTEAGHAVVVSNGAYTAAARQLAAKLGVLLLHHSQLAKLDEILPGARKPESRIILPTTETSFVIRPATK